MVVGGAKARPPLPGRTFIFHSLLSVGHQQFRAFPFSGGFLLALTGPPHTGITILVCLRQSQAQHSKFCIPENLLVSSKQKWFIFPTSLPLQLNDTGSTLKGEFKVLSVLWCRSRS